MLKVTVLTGFILSGIYASGQRITPYTGPFPVPPANKSMLFYLQRTMNKNTVVYEANYDAGGKINKEQPVKIHWVDFEDGGKISPLNFLQNKFAYGVELIGSAGADAVFKIHLVSYKKIVITLMPSGRNGSYQALVPIRGRESVLTSVLIDIVGGTYLKPEVYYIELSGKDVQTGEKVVEQIRP